MVCLIISFYLVLEEPLMQIRSPKDFSEEDVCLKQVAYYTVNASKPEVLQCCTLSLEWHWKLFLGINPLVSKTRFHQWANRRIFILNFHNMSDLKVSDSDDPCYFYLPTHFQFALKLAKAPQMPAADHSGMILHLNDGSKWKVSSASTWKF